MGLTGAYLENLMIQVTEEDIKRIFEARAKRIQEIEILSEIVNCPLCNNDEIIPLIEPNAQGKLGQCSKCKVVFAYERPTVPLSNLLYKYYIPSNLTDFEVRKSQLESRPAELNEDLDRLERWTDRGNLLDIGASSGDFLVYARYRGWKVEATELSEICADFMANNLNISVMLGNILDINFGEKKYKAISLRHSIEHLRDPINELKVLYNILERNGNLLITTPRHAEDLEIVKKNHMLPLHLVNYTRDTLTYLLSKTGFTILTYEDQDTGKEVNNMRIVAVKVG